MNIFRKLAKKLDKLKDSKDYKSLKQSLTNVAEIKNGLDNLLFPLIELLGCDNPQVKIEVIHVIREVFKNSKDELLIPMMYELVNETNFEVKFYTNGIIANLCDKRILPAIDYTLKNYKNNYFDDFETDLYGRYVCKDAKGPWFNTLIYTYAKISGKSEDDVFGEFYK